MNDKNNEQRNFIFNLDKELQAEAYIDRLPIFEMDDDGKIESNRVGNTFDIITELVSEGTQLINSGIPIRKNNSYLMFCLNNTMNYVYVYKVYFGNGSCIAIMMFDCLLIFCLIDGIDVIKYSNACLDDS